MKIRTDFVTNSSSSSFILSFEEQNNDNLTIEDAYQLIYKMYLEHYKTIKDIIDYVKSDPDSRMDFEEDGYLGFKNGKYEWQDEDNEKYWNDILKKFGEDLGQYDINEDKIAWIPLCPTYEDYLKYWTEKVYGKPGPNYNNHAPFSICDYRADTMEILHYRRYDCDWDTDTTTYKNSPIEKIDKSYNNDELGWYFYYLEDFLKDENFEPPRYSWQDEEDMEPIDDYKRAIKIRKETKDNSLFIERVLNGRFAILSEDCYIPWTIVNKLKKECKYCCNHMG